MIALLTSVLCWRVTVVNFAEHHAYLSYYSQYDDPQFSETPENVSAALAWSADQPHALVKQAFFLAESAPEQALEILQHAVRRNPTDARAYVLAGVIEADQGNQEKAQSLMRTAIQLAPMNGVVNQHIASYHFSNRKIKLAIPSLFRLLAVSAPKHRDRPFAALLALSSLPEYRADLAAAFMNPPLWWSQFFAYALRNTRDAEILAFLFSTNTAPSDADLRAYADFLMREKRWQEAYILWLDALTEQELSVAGLLFNGGFELPFSGGAFAWRLQAYPGAEIERRRIGDNHFLQFSFKGWEIPFKHLSQYLLLDPGAYVFKGRIRTENLETAQGLRWEVLCLDSPATPIAMSELAQVNRDWQVFEFQIEIPDQSCEAQRLNLISYGRFAREHRIAGIVQFDDLVITRNTRDRD